MSLSRNRDERLPIEVIAYSGAAGEEEPRALQLGERTLEVREILERWVEPAGRCFRVSTDDGGVHMLFCRQTDLTWWLVLNTKRVHR